MLDNAQNCGSYRFDARIIECHAHSNAHKPETFATPTLTPTSRPNCGYSVNAGVQILGTVLMLE